MYLHCPKCLIYRTGDVEGAKCQTSGCGGVIAPVPPFDSLVETLPEAMTCGRRFDAFPGGVPVHTERGGGQDRWQRFKANGQRVCSYCGSLHFDDFAALVKACADAPSGAAYGSVPEIEQSDKRYKFYVHQPGIRNAMEGGIKFYQQHVPRDEQGNITVTPEQQQDLARACRATERRFNARLYVPHHMGEKNERETHD